MHSNWRDCDSWRNENLRMTTTSNIACKFYDINLSQITVYQENAQYNGIVSSLKSMIEADPDFILGHCLKLGIEILGSDHFLNNEDLLKSNIVLKSKASEFPITRREQMHVKAIQLLHKGALNDACDYYEQILLENPTDMMAIKFSQSCYFYMGESTRMRDSIGRIIPFWKKSTPLQNYLYGMHAFGLVETNRVDEGRRVGYRALEFKPIDAWATHAVAHANEYSGNFKNGLKDLANSESEWSQCNMLAPHNYWHLALFNLEVNKHEEATQILDEQLLKSESSLDLVNSASLLIRLQLDGCKSKDYMASKWLKLKDVYMQRIEEHGYLYYDIHTALVLSTCGTDEEKKKYFDSFNKFINSDEIVDEYDENFGIYNQNKKNHKIKNYLLDSSNVIGTDMINGIFSFNNGDFDKCVDYLYPIRYDVYKMGGSAAQRDLICQILIHAALQSSLDINKKIGYALLNERMALVPDSDLTKRIATKFMTV